MTDWHSASSAWNHAHGRPTATAVIKAQPEHFQVVEKIDVDPSGEGEHVWLWVEKRRMNTEDVAKLIARHAKVAYRDVGYAGRKDYRAVTQQWFSVWLPRQHEPDWQALNSDRLKILKHHRHNRKLRTGAHEGNSFELVLSALSGDLESIPRALKRIEQHGVPNYFGLQRFGRAFSNMDNVSRWVRTAARSRDRRQQGMLLSAARAWLFNEALSSVVEAGRWNSIGTGQTVLLDGTASFFTAELGSDDAFELRERLKTGDVHPGLPLFGKPPAENAARAQFTSCYSTLADHYADLAEGLERSGLKTEWRASRCLPRSLCAAVEGDVLTIKFELPKGQFATTVLRELVLADGV